MDVGLGDRRWDPARRDGCDCDYSHSLFTCLLDTIPNDLGVARYYSHLFHRGTILAAARGPVAPGSMFQSLLSHRHVSLISVPNLQSRLLDGAGE